MRFARSYSALSLSSPVECLPSHTPPPHQPLSRMPKKGLGGDSARVQASGEGDTDGASAPFKSGKVKKPVVSRSAKAGLIWPVSRTHRRVVNNRGSVARVGAGAPVFIAAVTEFFAAELLELAGNLCKEAKQQGGARKRVMPKDVLHALRSDKELNKVSSGLRVLVGDKIKRIDTASAISVQHLKK